MEKQRYKHFSFIAVLIFAWLIAGCGAPPAIDAAPGEAQSEDAPYAGKRVLLVDSYHAEYDSSAAIVPAVQSAFEGTGIELRVLYMDTKRNDNAEFAQQAALEALAVIEEFQPDVVIATEDNAQEYLVVPHLRDTDLPVVFVGTNWDASIYGYPASNVTGSVEVELIDQLVEHLKQFAQGDRIAYLAIDSSTEQKAVEIYQERFFDGKLDVHLATSFDEYKATFIQLQDEADILLLGNNGGSDRWSDAEAASLFLDYTRIPTGSVREWTASFALISLAKDRAEDGEFAAQTVLQILDGTPISEIPMTQNKRGNLILNLDIAEKLDIVFSADLIQNASSVYGMEE